MNETIKLGIGLGELKFGATRDEARAHFGDPEEVAVDEEDGDSSEAWYYWESGLSLHFDQEDDFRLGTIETSSPTATLNGTAMVGLSKADVLELLSRAGMDDTDESYHDVGEDGERRECLIEVDSKNLSLWFEDDELTATQWSYFLNDDDLPIWPS